MRKETFFARNGTTDDVLAHIVLLAQVEQTTNLGGTLWAETTGHNPVSEAFDLVVT